jgi:hypothetical protein
MYGKPCILTDLGFEGQSPDGTARPGADMEFFVGFDEVTAGCDNLGYCNPGADIVWSVSGSLSMPNTQHIGLQYSERCGHCDTFRLIAPNSGTFTVTAKSANTITWVVTVSSVDISAGQIKVSYVRCANQEESVAASSPNCMCNGSNLTLYFTSTPTSVGNGMAYYDVYVNGSPYAENQVESTYDTHRDSVTISCPPAGSTITIKGKNDSGSSIVVYEESNNPIIPVGQYTCDDSQLTCVNGRNLSWCSYANGNGSWVDNGMGNCGTTTTSSFPICATPCSDDYCDSAGNHYTCYGGCATLDGTRCTPTTTSSEVTTTTTGDLMSRIKTFYENNKTMSIVGIALLGGLMLTRK